MLPRARRSVNRFVSSGPADQECIQLAGLVGTLRRNVRVCGGADASARCPYQRMVELEAPLWGNGAYIVPKTLRERRLRRFGCGALWKMMLRESFSICLSSRRNFR